MENQPAWSCTKCNQPATKHCSLCAEGVDIDGQPLRAYYCSEVCLHADRSKHRPACRSAKARQQLFRGGELVQQAFYAFLEIAFDMPISDVKIEGDKIHVYESEYDEDKDGPLHAFPNHLLSNPEDKEALLSYCACGDTLKYMFELMQKVLSGSLECSSNAKPALTSIL